MRFAIVFAVVFGLFSIGYAEDLATKLENASKPGSPEYREYQRKKAERAKLLAPIAKELKACVEDQVRDPSEALQAVKRYKASSAELGIDAIAIAKLRERSWAMGERAVKFLGYLGGDEYYLYSDLVRYAEQRYYDVDPEAKQNLLAAVLDPRGRVTPPLDPALAQRGVDREFAHSIDKWKDRDEVIKTVRLKLSLLDKSKQTDEDLSFCHLVWENYLLSYLYLGQRWDITASELGLTDEQDQDWRQQAKAIATRHGKDLLKELKKSPTWPSVREAGEFKLRLVFAFVPAKEFGTTERAAAILVDQLTKQLLEADARSRR